MRPVFIVLRDEVPQTPAHQFSKQPWGIGDRRETSALRRGHECQPLALTSPDDALSLSLFKEREQPCGVPRSSGTMCLSEWVFLSFAF